MKTTPINLYPPSDDYEVSLVETMPSVSLCKKLLNHLHFICLARGLDVTRPVIITNALTSINNHIIIESQ
ncbi:MAG: hypothetical protein ACLUR5_07595 [Eubacterium ventriosum]